MWGASMRKQPYLKTKNCVASWFVMMRRQSLGAYRRLTRNDSLFIILYLRQYTWECKLGLVVVVVEMKVGLLFPSPKSNLDTSQSENSASLAVAEEVESLLSVLNLSASTSIASGAAASGSSISSGSKPSRDIFNLTAWSGTPRRNILK